MKHSQGKSSRRRFVAHGATFLLGAALIFTIRAIANSDTQNVLMKLKAGDFEGIRNYLEIKESDEVIKDDKWAKRWSDMQQKIDQQQQRIDQLQRDTEAQRQSRNTLNTPFEIRDAKTGKQILTVTADDGGGILKMWNAAGSLPVLSLYPGTNGGSITTLNAAGQVVAAMGSGGSGGIVFVSGPTGGPAAVRLDAEGGGGSVKVYKIDAGGGVGPLGKGVGKQQLAEVSATDSHGSVTVYQGGRVAGMLSASKSKTAGFIDLFGDDVEVVEMGPTADNVGIIKAGPVGRGVAGVLGGGLMPASEIRGKAN